MNYNEKQALDALGALSNQTRLRVMRLLVQQGPRGMPAGDIAEAMDDASSSRMSFHLKELELAGLVTARREGRSIRYAACYEALSGLLKFLMDDCCQKHPAIFPACCQ